HHARSRSSLFIIVPSYPAADCMPSAVQLHSPSIPCVLPLGATLLTMIASKTPLRAVHSSSKYLERSDFVMNASTTSSSQNRLSRSVMVERRSLSSQNHPRKSASSSYHSRRTAGSAPDSELRDLM